MVRRQFSSGREPPHDLECATEPDLGVLAGTRQLDEYDGKIALPARIAGVRPSKPLGNGERPAQSRQRLVTPAERRKDIAESEVGDEQIPLPAGICRIGGGEFSRISR